MQTIDKFNFAGKKAFVRVDFNVPLDENFNITDDTRMRAALPTLKKILADGGSIIIGSHLGRPKGVADKFSLKHIIKHLSELLGVEVQFANDCMGEEAAVKAAALQPGEVLLLENLRFYAEEEGKPRGLAEDATDEEKAAAKKAVKESQKEFTKKLASYADCYVNDAFGTAHRAHASTALIAKYFDVNNKMFGYLMEKEVKAVDKVLNDIKRPFTAIMGGSKVSSKIEIIENLLSKVDNLIIAGGMTYTFTKAMGGKIGMSFSGIFFTSSFSTLNGVVQLSGTSPIRWLTRNTCVSTAIAAFLNTTDWITLAVFLPTPGNFIRSSRLSGTSLLKSFTSIFAIPTRCLALLLG
jgi:phosphoglycerate kinase